MKRLAVLLLGAQCFAGVAPDGALRVDFTNGCPEGFTPRPGAAFTADGLVPGAESGPACASGCQAKRRHVYSEAFRFEAEFVPLAGDASVRGEGVLWDDMYVTYLPKRRDRGLQVALDRRGDDWIPIVYLGLSNTTCRVSGPRRRLEAGRPARFSFLYDANRRVVWDFEGEKSETYIEKSGGLAQPERPAVAGDRVGSTYHALAAALRAVSITPVPREPFGFSAEGRLAFERAEKDASVSFSIENVAGASLSGVSATVRQLNAEGRCVATHKRDIGDVAQGGCASFSVPVQTRVRPGSAFFDVAVEGRGARGVVKIERRVEAAVGPTFAARMPALMWGFNAPYEVLSDYGFTHASAGFGVNRAEPDATAAARSVRTLDKALAKGLRFVRQVQPLYPPDVPASNLWRRLRDGSQPARQKRPAPEVSNPAMVDYVRRVAAVERAAFGEHPAFAGVLTCSELRDGTYPSFTTEHLRYKAETGREVPPEVNRKTFVLADAMKRFPDGVVPEDDPILAYYRWFWKGGDGWPGYTGAIAEEFRKGAGHYGDGSEAQRRRPFFSFFDPAVRCPPIWGSGGNVDVLNQWIYAVPEPMNVAGPLEEMFAMAAGRPGQQVMMMTQLICYRSQIAPSNVVVSPEPAWLAKRPRAGFPSIPPDSLQEATWSMLAKPVKGIMYHGWGTIYETGHETGYCYTNPETTERLKELLHGVVARLGPTLVDLGRDDSPVAVLESATTCLMGGPASWGWSAPAITFLQRARLDPRVVYEETVLRDGLGGVKVLYAPQCRFLTPSVIERIKAFQTAGGVLVGDEQMLGALKPDVLAPLVSFAAPPASDHTEDVEAMEAAKTGDGRKRAATVLAKAKMLRQAEELRGALSSKGYAPAADSSSPEIVVYSRRWKGARYVFAINDKRTFGDYVGQWGMTMEKGLPFKGEVFLADPAGEVGAVYELSRGGAAAFSRGADGRVAVPVEYSTNDGRLFAFLREPIGDVALEAKRAGGCIMVKFMVNGASGAPVEGRLPAEVRVRDAAGRELDGAGWCCVVDGVAELLVPVNVDDPPGGYVVSARDLASGKGASHMVK